ncbi:hypothetical protein BJ170DRAFT_116551 [Xylariales sp. AK1849]|nr:hypothetical protein BJ170DRAFT_116551 [Xylariales sp. AK1849]
MPPHRLKGLIVASRLLEPHSPDIILQAWERYLTASRRKVKAHPRWQPGIMDANMSKKKHHFVGCLVQTRYTCLKLSHTRRLRSSNLVTCRLWVSLEMRGEHGPGACICGFGFHRSLSAKPNFRNDFNGRQRLNTVPTSIPLTNERPQEQDGPRGLGESSQGPVQSNAWASVLGNPDSGVTLKKSISNFASFWIKSHLRHLERIRETSYAPRLRYS